MKKKIISMSLVISIVICNIQGINAICTDEIKSEVLLSSNKENNLTESSQSSVLKSEVLTYGDYQYTVSNSEATITSYNGSDENLIIPNEINGFKVTKIGRLAFSPYINEDEVDISPLVSVEVPENVECIEAGAFAYCRNLKSIKLPSTLRIIQLRNELGTEIHNACCFKECTNLEEVIIDENNPNYCSIEGVVYSKDKSKVLFYPEGKPGGYTIVIEDGRTTIGFYEFVDNKKVSKVIMPDTIEEIGNSAFRGCSNLKSIEFPQNISYIGPDSFQNSGLESLEVPNCKIGVGAFNRCKNLKDVTISEELTEVSYAMFYGCTALEEIRLPKSIKYIGEGTFEKCSNLSKVVIENGDATIEDSEFWEYDFPFSGCDKLTIYSVPGSKVEAYAKKYNIPFKSIEENSVSVKFDLNNGEDSIEKQVIKDMTVNYKPEAPVKAGYTFVGWFENVDDVTTEYVPGQKYNDNVTYVAKYARVDMLGAQVKAVVDDKSGIRFGTKIYTNGDEIVEKGTIIIPAKLLGEGEELTLETPNIAKSVAKALYEENKEENYVTYLGTIVNIPRNQFDTEMTAASYVIYKDKAGNEYTVYSPYKNESTTVNKLLGK